jgi:ribonuclease Z
MMQTISGALRKHGGGIDPDRMNLIISVHTPTDELATLATEANVEHLVLTHLIPPIPANGFVEAEFTTGMDKLYDGNITVARDGMRIELNQ